MTHLLQTQNDIAGFITRLTMGLIMLPHGLQKLLGMFGGKGFSGTMESMTSSGLPGWIVFLVIIGESFGAIGLIFGFLTRVAAFGINLIMLGAIFIVHLQHGFFMNWYGAQQGEGIEYHLLMLGLGITVMIIGGGKWSIDRRFSA